MGSHEVQEWVWTLGDHLDARMVQHLEATRGSRWETAWAHHSVTSKIDEMVETLASLMAMMSVCSKAGAWGEKMDDVKACVWGWPSVAQMDCDWAGRLVYSSVDGRDGLWALHLAGSTVKSADWWRAGLWVSLKDGILVGVRERHVEVSWVG